MDKDEWIYDIIMSEQVNMDEDTGHDLALVENIGMNVDCFDVFNTF